MGSVNKWSMIWNIFTSYKIEYKIKISNLFQTAELINLPLPLTTHQIIQRRQILREELNEKVHLLRPQTRKQIYMLKCPCLFVMCTHMAGLTEDLVLSWHPLESELAYFFINQPYKHLGILLYPHCVQCMDPSICGESH